MLTRGSFQATPVPPIHNSRNVSNAALVISASVSALLSNVSFFASMSYQDRMAAGSGTPFSRSVTARLTARLPPTEWPILAMFSGRMPRARSQRYALHVIDLRGELVFGRTPVIDDESACSHYL